MNTFTGTQEERDMLLIIHAELTTAMIEADTAYLQNPTEANAFALENAADALTVFENVVLNPQWELMYPPVNSPDVIYEQWKRAPVGSLERDLLWSQMKAGK